MIDVVYGEVPFPRALSEFDRNLFEHTWATMSPDTSEWFGTDGHIQATDLAKLALMTSVLTNLGIKDETLSIGGLVIHNTNVTNIATMRGLLAQELIDTDPENASRFMLFNSGLLPIRDCAEHSFSDESDKRLTEYSEEQERLRVMTLSMAMAGIARSADFPEVEIDLEQVIVRFDKYRPHSKSYGVSTSAHYALLRVLVRDHVDTVNKVVHIGKIPIVSLESNHPKNPKSRVMHLPRGNDGIGCEFGKLVKVLGITDLSQLRQ